MNTHDSIRVHTWFSGLQWETALLIVMKVKENTFNSSDVSKLYTGSEYIKETFLIRIQSLFQFLSDRVIKAARSLYGVMVERYPALIRDRKHHLKTYRLASGEKLHVTPTVVQCEWRFFLMRRRQCCSGKELVDWLLKQNDCMQSRSQAVGMWQVLVDEGILVHGENTFGVRASHTRLCRWKVTSVTSMIFFCFPF